MKILLAALFVLFFLFFDFFIVRAQTDHLIPFELSDQFDNVYTHEDFLNHIVVLTGSDRKGSQYNKEWGRAMYRALMHESIFIQIKWVGVADLGGIPFFLKGIVKNYFPEEKERWVLLDWDGEFAEAYKLQEDVSNIMIFDHQGSLVYQTTLTELDENKLDVILNNIRSQAR